MIHVSSGYNQIITRFSNHAVNIKISVADLSYFAFLGIWRSWIANFKKLYGSPYRRPEIDFTSIVTPFKAIGMKSVIISCKIYNTVFNAAHKYILLVGFEALSFHTEPRKRTATIFAC